MIQFINLLFGVVLSIFETVLGAVSEFAVSAFPSRRKTQFTADFLSSDSRQFPQEQERGFCITGTRSLSIEDSYSNAIVIGGSGSGKTSRILIPSILKMASSSSLVIHDPSGELFEKTSGFAAQTGSLVQCLNYSDPAFSEGYNPLYRVKTVSDIQKISNLVVHTALGSGKDPFWNNAAMNLISVFIRLVVLYMEPDYRTLHNVLHILNTFGFAPEKVDKLIIRSSDTNLIADYKAFVAYDRKMLMSIVATARTALSIFSDPAVAKVTATDTIDFEDFRHSRSILYINNSVSDMRYYAPISSLFFEQFFAHIMSRLPEKGDRPIFFLLDEASSLYLNLPTAISNIRKHGSGILQVYQHYNQLIDLYGQAQARNIAANCYAKVYMSGQSLETAKELEAMLGKFEFVDTDGISHQRQLMTADEIRQSQDAIILCGNAAPIKTALIPYYEQNKLRKRTEIPPYHVYPRVSTTPPSVTSFDA